MIILEFQFAVLPPGGEPQGEAERENYVLSCAQLREHPEGGMEGPLGLSPGAVQGQAPPTADGGGMCVCVCVCALHAFIHLCQCMCVFVCLYV